MFILNNRNARNYGEIYGRIRSQDPVIFDMSDDQIASALNEDWGQIAVGDLACVVGGSRRMAVIYQITSVERVEEAEYGSGEILRGKVVGRFAEELEYSRTLRAYHVQHRRLNDFEFCRGFNIANLGEQLDLAPVRPGTHVDARTVGELRQMYNP